MDEDKAEFCTKTVQELSLICNGEVDKMLGMLDSMKFTLNLHSMTALSDIVSREIKSSK